jgi:hypothetical protein
VSSANNKWETVTLPTLKPFKSPSLIPAYNIRLKASITKTNNNKKNGFPCQIPQELSKKPSGDPLTKTENLTEEMQKDIHEHHFAQKPHIFNIYNKKSQLT